MWANLEVGFGNLPYILFASVKKKVPPSSLEVAVPQVAVVEICKL